MNSPTDEDPVSPSRLHHRSRRPGVKRPTFLLAVITVALAAGATTVGLLLVGGNGDQRVDAPDETPSTAPDAQNEPDGQDPPPASNQPPDPGYFSEARQVATALYDAWQIGDQAGAKAVAAPEAVEVLFARPFVEGSWTARECDGHRTRVTCAWDAGPETVIMTVELSPRRRVEVSSVDFLADMVDEYVLPTPTAAPVGATVQIEGVGFFGDPWTSPEAPLYLLAPGEQCYLYAAAEHSIHIDANGHLRGDFVVPAHGDCLFEDGGAAVVPGSYLIAYTSTMRVIGTIDVE